VSAPLAILPFKGPLSGILSLPGSKSITNRALIIAALCDGPVTLKGALFSRDTLIMIEALRQLGFKILADKENSILQIKGQAGAIPNKTASLDVGNAGTAARFITAFLALQTEGEYTLDGDPQMRDRPMKGLIDALSELGSATFTFLEKPFHFPFQMKTHGPQNGYAQVDASASSQILSALLLTLPACKKDIQLDSPNVRTAYVKVTEQIKSHFGISKSAMTEEGSFCLQNNPYQAPEDSEFLVEPDLSAASYFFALTVLHGGSLSVKNIPTKPIQGDAAFAELLKSHALQVSPEKDQWNIQRPIESAIHKELADFNFNLFSDTFLTYAAVAPLLNKETTITGIKHTRLQETDRVSAMATELKKLGQTVIEGEDSLKIISDKNTLIEKAQAARAKGKTLEIETYEDHRFAMSFGILGTYDLLEDGQAWLSIKDPECCGKTFPDFFHTLESLRHDR
jgi:3-phosphoshikimate 1-carboxyvinyltransferase